MLRPLDLSETTCVILDVEGTIAGPDHQNAGHPVVGRAVGDLRSRRDEWSGISFVFDLLGMDTARAVGLGDGENDVVWMERIGTPVAMGNARPEARAVASAVAGHYAEEGAAVFLEDVLQQIP